MENNVLYEMLKKELEPYGKEGICIAFSGGVDSSLLLKAACDVAGKKKVQGVLFNTFLQPQGNLEEARKVAAECGALFSVLEIDELENPAVQKNLKDRCYHCKKFLYTTLLQFAKDNGYRYCMEGSNADDLQVYRPGLQAVKELGIGSPLAKLHITKQQVRAMAEELGLSVAKKPSNSCLATRLEYGRELDRALLAKIEAGERFLSELGFTNIRIRVHGDFLRIEIAPEEFPLLGETIETVRAYFKTFGWKHTTVDVFGFRSGTMDL